MATLEHKLVYLSNKIMAYGIAIGDKEAFDILVEAIESIQNKNGVKQMETSTYKWLEELGAVRPMAPAGQTVLVLGKWTNGHYPIEWCRYENRIMRDINGKPFPSEPIEKWRLFGIRCSPLNREDCEQILDSIGQQVKGSR